MAYTLYYSPAACSLAPHIVMEEIGPPYRLELRSTDEGETHTPEFYRINPKGRVPVLSREGFLLTEAPAILTFLADQRPDLMLMPDTAEDRARMGEWFNWLSGTVHATAVRMIWRPEHFTADAGQRPSIVARGHEHLASAFALIEAKLGEGEWAVGGRYSVVDPYLLVFYRWGHRMGLEMANAYPSWTRQSRRMLRRPAVGRALEREGISIWK